MLKRFTNFCIKLANKYLPDPFLFAVILSAVLFILGMVLNQQTPLDMINHWGAGFWSFLGFSMQMVLVIVFGNTLAYAPIFDRILKRLAKIPKTPTQAVAFVTLVSGFACIAQWGFGLVIGAIFAREIAKQVKNVDYRLLIAAAYCTFMLNIPTSTMPLKAASNPEELAAVTSGVLTEVIPITQTVYNPVMLGLLFFLFITMPIITSRLHPAKEDTITIDPALLVDEDIYPPEKIGKLTPAEKLENSRLVSFVLFVCGFTYVAYNFYSNGFNLTIDLMNFMLLFLSILLHKTPIRFLYALRKTVSNATGIIVQFPFYAGIMGMMTGVNAATGLSLAAILSNGIVSIATTATFPLFSFLSAAVVNLFVPSAGGQWGVQAAVMFPAGDILNVDNVKIIMSMAWGDVWTNLIQPFWALPALGIAGLGVRDIMGYCVVIFLYTGVIICGTFLLWGFLF